MVGTNNKSSIISLDNEPSLPPVPAIYNVEPVLYRPSGLS